VLASLCQSRRVRTALSFGLLTGLILLLALGPSSERVRGAPPGGVPTLYTVCDLKRMTPCELEQLFASVEVGPMPSGWMPGELLVLTDFPMPRISEALARGNWRGKQLGPDGSFVNQFRYRQRFSSQAVIAPSLYDGRPAIVMAYPPDTPFFRNIRDEFREVSPGLYLGRIYNTAKCPRLLGFMYLRVAGCCPPR
jgi:hypothetical protein